MGLFYKNLDDETRKYMLQEDDLGGHYRSPRLVDNKWEEWLGIFREALSKYNDDWLADEINKRGLMKQHEFRKTKNGMTTVKVPYNAALMLSEGEFNRFYLRGIASRIISEGFWNLKIYRGKEVSNPRPESEAKIGDFIAAALLLAELRQSDFVDNALKLPAGPNSGLTAEMTRE